MWQVNPYRGMVDMVDYSQWQLERINQKMIDLSMLSTSPQVREAANDYRMRWAWHDVVFNARVLYDLYKDTMDYSQIEA